MERPHQAYLTRSLHLIACRVTILVFLCLYFHHSFVATPQRPHLFNAESKLCKIKFGIRERPGTNQVIAVPLCVL
ncbi:hypothetical protein ANTPLA_LOCUS7190 [Anthophora plagiata]